MPSRPPTPDAPGPASPPGAVAALLSLALAGICAFLNVYATQPLLPLLGGAFGVSEASAALTVSAPPIAIALASPFVGALAERVGRRRLIVGSLFALSVPTLLAATAPGLRSLLAWRFAQGLAVPGVYAVSISYVAAEWAEGGLGRAMAIVVSGNVVGGFLGRVVAALVAERAGWRAAFVALGALTLAGALAVARGLPRDRRPAARRGSPLAGLRALAGHLDDPRLLATFAVGFNVLFTLVATFTYVTLYLSEPPFRLGAGPLSWMFSVYLVGALVVPFAGRWIDRVGPRAGLAAALVGALAGGGLTLVHSLWVIGLGLALSCSAAFVSQSASTSHLQATAPAEVRSAASGVYVSCYYLGGSAGGALPALAWHAGGWPACVALVAAVQLASLALALRFWRRPAAGVDLSAAAA